jgi:hypothetical protein
LKKRKRELPLFSFVVSAAGFSGLAGFRRLKSRGLAHLESKEVSDRMQ